MRKPPFAVRLFLCLVLAGLTLELVPRAEDAIHYGAPIFQNYSLDSLYQYDAIGKYGRPHANYLKWHLNSAGYRGPELRQGTYRIVTLGSSETFGLYESPQKEWPRQLEDILTRQVPADHYEVVNVSYPGLTVGTTLRRVPQIVATVHPKLVIIYPAYSPYIEIAKPTPWPVADNPHPRLKATAFHFESRLADHLQTLSKSILPISIQQRMRALQLRYSAHPAASSLATVPEQNVLAFQTDLDHLVTDLQSRGIQVILITHATRFGNGPLAPADAPYLTDWRKFYPQLEESGLLDNERRMSAAVFRVGSAHNVPVVDAASAIAGGHNFAEFTHFTDAGAQALASLVATQIERNPPANLPQ